jgi:hypothetical protein
MKIELLPEPKVEFANNFLCDDPKMGISVAGFYSHTNHTHRSEIQYAVIGTNQLIQDFNDWIATLKTHKEADRTEIPIIENSIIEDGEVQSLFSKEEMLSTLSTNEDASTFSVNKKLNPDFPGFNKEGIFKCEFQNDSINNVSIKKTVIDTIVNSANKKIEKADEVIGLYVYAYQQLMDKFVTKPDICYLVIPSNVFKKLASIPSGSYHINLRRKLKASIMALEDNSIPVQLILEDTIKGTKKQIQTAPMIAWNFVVAQYYKTANCIPWALTDIDKDTCFVGVSFHKVINGDNHLLRSSIAQAFNREGKGLVFVGKQFEWDSETIKVSAPHLRYEYARELIISVLKQYSRMNNHIPKRVVIYKTTDFWDSQKSKEFAEIEGFKEGIKEELGANALSDLVTIKDSRIKLLRTSGKYPVLRGTNFIIDDFRSILFTTGYIPYYETFPGVNTPAGLSVEIFDGDTTLRNVCREIMSLTKLNFNNCNYFDGLPITLKFAQKVGEIIQYLPEGVIPPSKYYYYM